MAICPTCDNEVDGEYFECHESCHTSDIWWCEKCGSIAISYDGYEPDDDDWLSPEDY